MPGSCVPYGVRVKVLRMQHNHWSRIFFSIQECIFGIRPIRGKMRSAVWTVYLQIDAAVAGTEKVQ